MCKLAADEGKYIVSGRRGDPKTQEMLQVVRESYAPNKVVIQLDPDHLPAKLLKLNSVLNSLVDTVQKEQPSLRICEGGTCHLPIFDIEEARQAVRT